MRDGLTREPAMKQIHDMTRRHHHKRTAGFTMAEVLIASSVLSIAVLAIVDAVTTGQQTTYQAMHDMRGMALAEAMMEEIQAKPYDDPDGGPEVIGPEPGEVTRASFDNADDYHNYNEAVGGTEDVAGADHPSLYAKFGRTVTTVYENVAVAEFGGDQAGLTITVTVTDNRGQQWTITRFMREPNS